MTKKDLRTGMVVAIKNREHDYFLAMVAESKTCGKCISSPETWYPFDCLKDDLTYVDDVIIEVYDHATTTKKRI